MRRVQAGRRRRELGNPWDIKMAIEDWVEAKWSRVVINLGDN
jgi:hypothetical protein